MKFLSFLAHTAMLVLMVHRFSQSLPILSHLLCSPEGSPFTLMLYFPINPVTLMLMPKLGSYFLFFFLFCQGFHLDICCFVSFSVIDFIPFLSFDPPFFHPCFLFVGLHKVTIFVADLGFECDFLIVNCLEVLPSFQIEIYCFRKTFF